MEGEDWEKASSIPPAVLTRPPLQDQVSLLSERDLGPAFSVMGWPHHSVQGGEHTDDMEGPGCIFSINRFLLLHLSWA